MSMAAESPVRLERLNGKKMEFLFIKHDGEKAGRWLHKMGAAAPTQTVR